MTSEGQKVASTPMKTLGKVWPNLVLVRDSEYGAEFRVQCEVVLNEKKDVDQLEKLLFGGVRTKGSLDDALALVNSHINPDAKESFRTIVDLGFKGQVQYIETTETKK
jgi:hypothetical protein